MLGSNVSQKCNGLREMGVNLWFSVFPQKTAAQ
jgi:hypothetical protein